MKCPRCQVENDAGARYCEDCGARLEAACPSCGTPITPGKKFCRTCGVALTPEPSRFTSPESYTPKHLAEKILTSKTALEGERKQVTVLFADLKGSMELLADRDPEEARKLLDPVLGRMMEAVHRYEGTVNQVMGDGIMALFGAPIAHEDHAVRACYAALRMQESVKKYAEEVRRSYAAVVKIRVGLNAGEVVVRSIASDLRMDYSAVGQTTHLAARMEQVATPGSILLTPAALHLVEGYVQVTPLGPMAIRGLAQPIEVYELDGATATRSRLQAAATRGLTRFVGRDAELATLRQALERAQTGHGQVVAIVGEPGVGKSRLVYELIHSHRTQGWLVLEGGSVSFGKATPYLPIADLLKTYFQIEDRDGEQRVREKVTGKLLTLDERVRDTIAPILSLVEALPEDDPFRSLEPPQRRGRTEEALRQVLLRESQRQPVLLVFEDLHWVDAESEAMINALVESLPTSPLLLLTSYRPEYQDQWGAKTYYARLGLHSLPPGDADGLLDALLGDDTSMDALKTTLKERTEGNPFFLEESVRALAETGALRGQVGAYQLEGVLHTPQMPATVQALLASRIDRLPVQEKRLLQAAAVIGMDVPRELLQQLVDLPGDALSTGLAHLNRAELLYEARLFPDTEYTFKHALTRDVAYETLLQEQRRLLHRRVGELLESRHAGHLSQVPETLASHFEQAEVWPQAASYCLLAAEKAKELYNFDGGAEFCRRALDLAARDQNLAEVKITALVLLGDLWSLMGDLGKANESYDRALEAATAPAEQTRIANKRHEFRSAISHEARIGYYEHGAGDETLVVAHSLVYDPAAFQPVIEQLCDEFRIITIDPRGAGRSDSLRGPYTGKEHAEDLRAVIEAAVNRPVIGIGHLRGAKFMLRLAVTHPMLMKSLVLIAPGSVTGQSQGRDKWASALGTQITAENIGIILTRLVADLHSETGTQDLEQQFIRYCLSLPPETFLNHFDSDGESDLLPLLSQIEIPTLVIWGTADRGAAENARRVAECIKGAQLYGCDGRGHWVLATATTEVCQVLRRFIRTGVV